MATKASRIALAGSNISSTGEVDADLLDNTDSSAFLSLDSNGRLGIGTTSSDALLHVQHTSVNEAFIVANRYNDTSTGSDFKPIFAVAEADPHSNGVTATIIGNHNRHIHIGPYFAPDGTTSAVGALTILSTGRVGIGESNPDSKLHIRDATDGGSSSTTSAIQFSRRSGGANDATIKMQHDGSDGISNLQFHFGTSERMRIDSSGNIQSETSIATSSFRIGDNSHWKIRGNNAYTDLAFEYATSSGLSDSNIKVTMKSNGDLVVNGKLDVNGDYISLPTSATDPSGGVAGAIYYNTSSQNLKIHNGTRWSVTPSDTIFDIFGDGSIEAFYEFNNNLNDTGGTHNMSVSDFQTTDGSGYVTGKSGMAWKVGFEDWLLYRGIGLGNASSWSVWCKDLNSEGSNSILFGAGVWNSGLNGDLPGYGIFVDSSNNCYPYNKPGGTYNWTSNFTVSGWTHIAMSSGSGTVKTYVNGSLWNTKTSTTTASSINTLTSGRRLYHHDEDMAVTLDNVRIYNRVLTDAEVTQIYNLEA